MSAKQARIPVTNGAGGDMDLLSRALACDADVFRTIMKQKRGRMAPFDNCG